MLGWSNILPQEYRRIRPLLQGKLVIGCILYTGPFVRICLPRGLTE